MDWFNIYGLKIIAIIMIPNIAFALRVKDGFKNYWHNKTVEVLEQIGRFGCFGLMIFNIPGTYFGFWFENALPFYAATNAILVITYCVIWGICFKKNSVFRALALSIIPSIIFMFSGVLILSVPLIILAAIFAPCHILLSYKNAVLSQQPI